MPTKSITERETQLLPEVEEMSPDEELLSVLADIGDDDTINVKVYRAKKGSRSTSFLYECPPSEFNLEFLRDNYGSGDYRVQIRDGSKLISNKLIGIEALKLPQVGMAAKDESVDKILESFSGLYSETKKDMAEMQQQNMQVLLAALSKQNSGGGDMATMMQLLMQNQQQNMQMILSMMENNKGRQPESDSSKMFETFIQGLNMGKEMNPSTGAETNDVIIEAIKGIGPMFAQAAKNNERSVVPSSVLAGQPVQPAKHPGQSFQPQKQIAETEEDMNFIVRNMMQKKLQELCGVAARNGDIELYTDLVLDQVAMNYIEAFLQEENPIGYLSSIEPGVARHAEWFAKLIANIKMVIGFQSEDEQLTTPPESDTHARDTLDMESASDAVTGEVIDAESEANGNS